MAPIAIQEVIRNKFYALIDYCRKNGLNDQVNDIDTILCEYSDGVAVFVNRLRKLKRYCADGEYGTICDEMDAFLDKYRKILKEYESKFNLTDAEYRNKNWVYREPVVVLSDGQN